MFSSQHNPSRLAERSKDRPFAAFDPPFLAKPSGECCLKGSIHTGRPQGSFITLAGVETYLARPTPEQSNRHILLYYPDVWGMFTNGLLVMDAFAERGYLTIGLDYFRGDPVWKHRRNRSDTTSDPGFDYEAWKRKHTAFADSVVPKWISAVKEQFGTTSTRYACVGYCFGAPYVCKSLASVDGNEPVCSVGAFAHPAFLKEHHFRQLERPLFLSCSEIDHTFDTASRRLALEIMRQDGKKYHLQLFSGVQHGFALRGDLEKPYERWVKEQSLDGIVRWFDFWFGEESTSEPHKAKM
ncbi:hypothetical protein M409DRAFT_63541 [Zasmidium cellare ATCC 36951]|uniref:Dienelactone hydrolase domain-containing protein n=1 Tax=Zasmidium cellare ATCC 36951 TaxID=1080233 RepID=A0A6A6CYB7_ZASCE|nr:uncharacterized protein M409DRAFT_63541 [Zasmidium cellare ATCC 36951]KAF2172045.1 hypothetical protein M409DRAFT_63541 [Zasmidium cellare ATCC 36951]